MAVIAMVAAIVADAMIVVKVAADVYVAFAVVANQP